MMSHVIVIQVTRHDRSVTQSYNIEKIVEDFKIDDIIQYSNSMLVL